MPLASSFLYLAVLVGGTYYNAAGLCGPTPATDRLAAFMGILGFLVAIEYAQWRHPALGSPGFAVVALLVVRMVLFEAVAAVDCSGLSKTLFSIVPFTAYFVLGKRASYALTALYLATFVARLGLSAPAWYLSQRHVSDLLMFSISLAVALALANVASEAEASRARAERLLGRLEAAHEELNAYAGRVADLAASEERNRLARDIHDSLGHYLTAIAVQLEKATTFWDRDARLARRAMLDARRCAGQALQDVRASVGALRRAGEVFSLAESLRGLVENVRRCQVAVDLDVAGDERHFPKPALMALYRAAQEGLTNAQQHGRARHVSVRVSLGDAEAVLEITDDGRGFAPGSTDETRPRRDGGFGLPGVRERLELVGGSLTVLSTPGHGTRLRAEVPMHPPGVIVAPEDVRSVAS